MQPRLEIRRVGPEVFVYRVRASRATAPLCECSLASLARCLNDAGDSLGHYFSAVSVSLDDQDLGSYAIERLLHHANNLAAELIDKARPAARKLSS
jgi:hypothetical protein